MLAALLAMPVSVGLLIWFLRMKKDDPFPKYTFVKLLIAGAIAGILSAIVTFAGAVINLLMQMSPEQIKLLTNTEGILQVVQQISQTPKTVTPDTLLLGFIRTFILIGFVEEFFKFMCAKVVMRKEGVVRTWKDALLCFAVTAVSFQLIEDIGYASGNIIIAVFRALTPFHFTFAVAMGYFYGLGKIKENRLYSALGIIAPAFIHTLYDFSLNLVKLDDNFVFLALLMNAVMFILTVFTILKLRKSHKNKDLDIPIRSV